SLASARAGASLSRRGGRGYGIGRRRDSDDRFGGRRRRGDHNGVRDRYHRGRWWRNLDRDLGRGLTWERRQCHDLEAAAASAAALPLARVARLGHLIP